MGAAGSTTGRFRVFVKNNGNEVRVLLAVVGVPLAFTSYWTSSYYSSEQAKKSTEQVEKLTEQAQIMASHAQATNKLLEELRTVSQNESLRLILSSASEREVRRGRNLLGDNFTCMPAAKKDRTALREFAAWASLLAVGFRDGGRGPSAPATTRGSIIADSTIAEWHGAFIERAVANPYIQDQLLGNPARWKSLITVARDVIAALPDEKNAERTAAKAFLDSYDRDMAECKAIVAFRAELDPVKRKALRRAAGLLVAGDAETGCYVFCPATKLRIAKQLPAMATEAGSAIPASACGPAHSLA